MDAAQPPSNAPFAKASPSLRRRIVPEIDAHNDAQSERKLRALLQRLNDMPSSSVPNKDEEALIEAELQSANFLSLPWRPDDHYVTAAFASKLPEERRSHALEDAGHVLAKPPSTLRGRAFDVLRAKTSAIAVGHLGTSHEHAGRLGRQRANVHLALDVERERRQKAGRETVIPRSPRARKRDAAARKRQEKQRPVWQKMKERPSGNEKVEDWLLGSTRADAPDGSADEEEEDDDDGTSHRGGAAPRERGGSSSRSAS